MRIYLLISVTLSLILPLQIIPIQWSSSILPPNLFNNPNFLPGNQPEEYFGGQTLLNDFRTSGGNDIRQGIIILLIVAYIIGLLYKAYTLVRNLRSIQNCIKQNPKVREGRFWFVDLIDKVPPFSFFNYIFITNSYQRLSADDLQRIKDHEKVHAQQFHSLDVLFIEIISIIFWFNPLLTYLKKSVQEIHEYIVDEKIAERGKGKKDYAQLLLKLASEVKGFNLSAGFTGNQIKRRIIMITKQRSQPRHKLTFTILVPITILMTLSFSYINNPDPLTAQKQRNENVIYTQLKIGEIIWKGNTVYDTKTLNKAFGLKKGDNYNQKDVANRLGLGNLPSLYLDYGYLFFTPKFKEIKENGLVNLTITIYEGKQVKVSEIIIKGNVTVPNTEILKQIEIKSGDLFSLAKILKSVQALEAMGKFDPEKINPKPIPHITTDEFDNVDLLYELTEISNKK
jgi:hypothetical protein